MSFFKKFANLFFPSGGNYEPGYWITVKCNRCGEEIHTRIDLRNDLSIDYGEDGSATTYFCRKTIIGSLRCYQGIEVELVFDANHKLINRDIKWGKFLDEHDPPRI